MLLARSARGCPSTRPGILSDPRGEQAAAANAIGSGPTKHGPLPHTMGIRPWKRQTGVPNGIIWLWGAQHWSVLGLCPEDGGSGSTWSHLHSQRVTLRGQEVYNAGAEPLLAPPISLPAQGSSPAPLHPGSTTELECVRVLCSYKQHPLILTQLNRHRGARTDLS